MDEGRFLKRLAIGSTVLVGSLIAVGVTSDPSDRPAPRLAVSSSSYSHELLQRDAEMTQRMASPGADGPMQRGQTADDQLAHAHDRAFVGALEQHQADIDRMLARPSR